MNDPNINLSFRGFVYSVLAVSDPEIQRLFSEIELQGFNILQDLKSFMTDIERLKLNAGEKGIDQAKLTEFERKIKAWVINNYALTDLSNVKDIAILNKLKNVDGTGSGLDANFLEGHDSTYFLPATGKAVDSDKLDGLDSTDFVRTIDYEDSDVLAKIKNVDGSGSGLDADLLDGNDSLYFAKDADLSAHTSNTNNPHSVTANQIGASNILTELKTVDGAGSGLDADLLDGIDSTDLITKKTYLYATGSGGDTGATKNTWTLIPFVDNQVSRGGSINHPGDNRFTVNNTGLYHISVQIPFNNQPDGSDTRISIHKNGTTLLNSDMPSGKAGGNPSPNISIDIQLTAGDYLEFYGWTSGGGNFSGDPHWKFVSIIWLGE